MAERSAYFDGWKGLAVLAVILIHASGVILHRHLEAGSETALTVIELRQIANFPVALFVFLSGWFALSGGGLGKRLLRLALPYLLWAVIYCGPGLLSGSLSPGAFLKLLLNGNAIVVGYFVIMMLQMTVVSLWLERLDLRALGRVLAGALVVSLVYSYAVQLFLPGSLPARFPYMSIVFFIWLPFYAAGLAARRMEQSGKAVWRTLPAPVLWAGLGITLALSMLEARLLSEVLPGLANSQLKLTSVLMSGAVCLTMLAGAARGPGSLIPALAGVGRDSYFYYLSHMLFLVPAQRFTKTFVSIAEHPIVFILLTWLLTFCLCAGAATLLHRLAAGAPRGLRLLGLSPRTGKPLTHSGDIGI